MEGVSEKNIISLSNESINSCSNKRIFLENVLKQLIILFVVSLCFQFKKMQFTRKENAFKH